MPRPKIVKETRRRISEMEPPDASSLSPHIWMSDEGRVIFSKRLSSKSVFDVYVSSLAQKKMLDHAEEQSPRGLEVLGFLVGEVGKWKGRTFTVVRDVATTELRSTPAKVRFAPEAYPRLFHQLDALGFDYIIVGWYHSHPGHTCFLSRTDLETQRSTFNQPYHVALVIDPVNRDVRTFRLSQDGYEETSFAVFAGEPPRPSARKARTRKLRLKPAVTR